MDSLRIVFWNARGINNSKLELHNFLIERNVGILLANETWLQQSQKFAWSNYKTYRQDRLTGQHGGVLILIKSNVDYCFQPYQGLESVEATAVKVKINSSTVTFTAVYNKPGNIQTDRDFEVYSKTASQH